MTKNPLKPLILLFIFSLAFSSDALAYNTPFPLSAAEAAAPILELPSGFGVRLPSAPTTHVPSLGSASSSGMTRGVLTRVGRIGFGLAGLGMLAVEGYRLWVDAHPHDNPISWKLLHPGDELPPLGVVLADKNTGKRYLMVSSLMVYDGSYACLLSENHTHNGTAGTYTICTGDTGNGIHGTHAEVYTDQLVVDPHPGIDSAAFAQSLDQIYSDVVPEIDKYISENPGALELPASLKADTNKAISDSAAKNQQEANSALVDTQKSRMEAAQLRYNTSPTDQNKEALDAAIAEYLKSVAEQAATDKDIADDDGAAPPPIPEYLQLNFQPLVDMGDELSDKFPFTLLATLKNFAQGLVATPVAPSFDIEFPAPFNFSWHVSLERFDPIARMVRVLIGMAFLAYITMALLRRFH